LNCQEARGSSNSLGHIAGTLTLTSSPRFSPASSTSTVVFGSSERRVASTRPASPPPTTTKSKVSDAIGCRRMRQLGHVSNRRGTTWEEKDVRWQCCRRFLWNYECDPIRLVDSLAGVGICLWSQQLCGVKLPGAPGSTLKSYFIGGGAPCVMWTSGTALLHFAGISANKHGCANSLVDLRDHRIN
jgi:hypothetical protein